jgi:putative membrane protein
MSIIFRNSTLPIIHKGFVRCPDHTIRPLLYNSFNNINIRGVASEPTSSKDPPLYIRRDERSALRPSLYHIKRPNDSRIARNDRLEPTRDLNYDPGKWKHHKAPGRHLRNLFEVFSCASFQRLVFPDLFLTASVGAGLTYYNVMMTNDLLPVFYFDTTTFTTFSLAMSVLAGFRLNTSYDRLNEARKVFGQVNTVSRGLMGKSCMFLTNNNKQRMKTLLKSFAVAMHFHLNTKGGYYRVSSSDPEFKVKLNNAYKDEMREIFFSDNDEQCDDNNYVAVKDFEKICMTYESGSHVPLMILSCIRKIIIENQPTIEPIYCVDMDSQVQNLMSSLGSCERLLRTPIPTTFTTNTSRYVYQAHKD